MCCCVNVCSSLMEDVHFMLYGMQSVYVSSTVTPQCMDSLGYSNASSLSRFHMCLPCQKSNISHSKLFFEVKMKLHNKSWTHLLLALCSTAFLLVLGTCSLCCQLLPFEKSGQQWGGFYHPDTFKVTYSCQLPKCTHPSFNNNINLMTFPAVLCVLC